MIIWISISLAILFFPLLQKAMVEVTDYVDKSIVPEGLTVSPPYPMSEENGKKTGKRRREKRSYGQDKVDLKLISNNINQRCVCVLTFIYIYIYYYYYFIFSPPSFYFFLTGISFSHSGSGGANGWRR